MGFQKEISDNQSECGNYANEHFLTTVNKLERILPLKTPDNTKKQALPKDIPAINTDSEDELSSSERVIMVATKKIVKKAVSESDETDTDELNDKLVLSRSNDDELSSEDNPIQIHVSKPAKLMVVESGGSEDSGEELSDDDKPAITSEDDSEKSDEELSEELVAIKPSKKINIINNFSNEDIQRWNKHSYYSSKIKNGKLHDFIHYVVDNQKYSLFYNMMPIMREQEYTLYHILDILNNLQMAYEYEYDYDYFSELWDACLTYDAFCNTERTTAKRIVSAVKNVHNFPYRTEISSRLIHKTMPINIAKKTNSVETNSAYIREYMENISYYSPYVSAYTTMILVNNLVNKEHHTACIAFGKSKLGNVLQHIHKIKKDD
jgi:hypothetical protein